VLTENQLKVHSADERTEIQCLLRLLRVIVVHQFGHKLTHVGQRVKQTCSEQLAAERAKSI
jgi:hypothetical protein